MASHLNLSQPRRSRNSRSWDKRNSAKIVRTPQFLWGNESPWNEMNKPRATCKAVTKNPKMLKTVVDPSKFSTWNKLFWQLQQCSTYFIAQKKCEQTITNTFVIYFERGIKLGSKCKIRTSFWNRNKFLMTIATVFKLIYWNLLNQAL